MSSLRSVLLSAMLLGLPLQGALAQARPPAVVPVTATQERTLRVEGQGEVKVSPDEAFLDLSMETKGASAQVASDANAKKMEKVIAALVQAGVARKDIETRNYSVGLEYVPPVPGQDQSKPKGYLVNNSVQVHVRDMNKVGPLLDTALKAGANRVDSVRFGLSKPETGRDGALRDAVERARQSAQVLATALGVKLGPVLDASTITEPVRPMPMARFAMVAAESADVSTPIQAQEQTVNATVTLIYAIEAGSK